MPELVFALDIETPLEAAILGAIPPPPKHLCPCGARVDLVDHVTARGLRCSTWCCSCGRSGVIADRR